MSSATQKTAGVQQLLEAERKASEKVQKAREYRTEVLRKARDSAKSKIEEKRKSEEKKYNDYSNKHDSGSKSAEEQAEKDVTERVTGMQEALSKNQDVVVKELVEAVVTVA